MPDSPLLAAVEADLTHAGLNPLEVVLSDSAAPQGSENLDQYKEKKTFFTGGMQGIPTLHDQCA